MWRVLPAGWAVPVVALLVMPVTARAEEPFHGKAAVDVTSVNIGDCFDEAAYTGSGRGQPLGALTGIGKQRVQYCGAPDIEGAVALTDETGDQISLHYVGTRVSPTHFRCDVVATYGTGRYRGATVDAVLSIKDYSPGGPYRLAFKGTVSFP